MTRLLALLLALAVPTVAAADTGAAAWLRYAPLPAAELRAARAALPATIVTLGDDAVVRTAGAEMVRGLHGVLAREARTDTAIPTTGGAIVIGTLDALRAAAQDLTPVGALDADAFSVRTVQRGAAHFVVIAGGTGRGALYGAFALLRHVSTGAPVTTLDLHETPYAEVRWINQWDNIDGTIERGYGGRSIFWDAMPCPSPDTVPLCGHVRDDLSRVGDYGRLLASLGINGLSINNVNANPKFLGSDLIPQVARVAAAFRPWGIRVALAIDFGSPQTLGGLPTYDPLDPTVIAWWRAKADEIYRAVPDFAGFVLKADSEGRVGPSTYGRSHADAANVVARALAPHHGLIFYRGFVYDHHMDWQNPKNDRGRAAYDNFAPLDGKFDANVIVQIKNGPIDFQVREPASPLVGALEHTNEAMELQITQEYLGQAKHTVFLVPMWKATLDFDLHVHDTGAATPVKAIVAGRVFPRIGGFVGVANVGLDDNWFDNHLSQANLYGFGRLAWNPDLGADTIVNEWTKLTFGLDPAVVQTIGSIQLSSWRTYENYTGPLGLQTLTDIVGNHYGVAVEASERNGWGQWHNADATGVGMDRTVATGTGYIGQYHPSVASVFESLATCPDDLLLFLHHVPYAYILHSGKTVIQSLYDSHYEGADAVQGYVRSWTSLKGKIDDERYRDVLAQLDYQAGQAVVWRDAVSMWFFKTSNIADTKARVGHYPGRIEAESEAVQLSGYVVKPVKPWESASGGQAVECTQATCTATVTYRGPATTADVTVRYFDLSQGASHFKLFVGDRLIDEWAADAKAPIRRTVMDGSSSARRVFAGVTLRAGDRIRIEGTPEGGEKAGLDYIEIAPAQTPPRLH